MTTLLLIRHGETDAVGNRIMGWHPGWHLNVNGKRQAAALAERLKPLPIRAIYTSPLERAIETAEPVAREHGLTIRPVDDLGEMRLGEWEGLTIAELEPRNEFKRFNSYRSGTRVPGGEMMLETQTRLVRYLDKLRIDHPGETIAVVSHGDPLRAVIAHFLGLPLDFLLRFEISPASVSIVRAEEWGGRLLCLNHTGDLPT